jgi:hypothetical protein
VGKRFTFEVMKPALYSLVSTSRRRTRFFPIAFVGHAVSDLDEKTRAKAIQVNRS